MADPVPLIDAAIYSRLGTAIFTYTTAGTAQYVGTLPIVNTLAIQQTAPPYVVFQQMTSQDTYAFADDAEQSFDYTLKALSLKSYPSQEANPVYATAHNNLQDAPLSVAGFKVLKVRRSSRIRYRDGAGFWNIGGLYTVWVAKD